MFLPLRLIHIRLLTVGHAFDDAEKIFKSKEAQKFISDKIVNELQREIDKIGTIKIR